MYFDQLYYLLFEVLSQVKSLSFLRFLLQAVSIEFQILNLYC